VDTLKIHGRAVLRDFPLRLWAEQQEHYDGLLREFQLLLIGQGDEPVHEAPRALVELAEVFTSRFGPLIQAMNDERQAALDRGQDRMDSSVPLVEDAPAILAQVDQVLAAADEYCSRGDLLVLPRPAVLLAFGRWVSSELIRQYEGQEPVPWPGPF